LHGFLSKAADKMSNLLQSINILKEKFDSLANFFGEDPSVDVLQVVNEFAKTFEVRVIWSVHITKLEYKENNRRYAIEA
jgi:hypothetical protein